jgi:hypothetical protein
MYDRILTQDGLMRLAALGDLATCGDLAQRTGVSWRATVSRPIVLDAPALEVDHVIYADLRTCASQSRDARRLRDARWPHGVGRLRGARRSTPRLTRPRRLRSAPSSFNVYALALKATTLDATMRSTAPVLTCARVQVKAATHDGFATHDGLVTLDGLAVRDARPCAQHNHIGCALCPRRSTCTRSRSR